MNPATEFLNPSEAAVESSQTTLVPLYQAPHTPEPLQQAIVLKNPDNSRKYYYSKLPPKIRFVWDERPESEGYEFVLARDETFRDVVMEEILPKPEMVHGNLKKGTYYWKVKAQDQSGAGQFSGQRRLDVVKDRTPPMLRVRFPGKIVHSDKCSLKGKTEPGANVFVDGRPVKVSRSGQFRHQLTLQRGINVVVVEAVDRADNVAYRSQLIHGKF